MLRLSDPLVSVRVLPAVAAAALWAAAAGAAVFWWLHLPHTDSGAQTPASVMPVPQATQGTMSVQRALGHTSAEAKAPDAQRRFQLLGVIAADSGQGSALLAVDGLPPQAFVQGQTVADGWRLQSVGQEGVRLSAGQAGATLELALPVKP